ncbi:MAG: hypothetical protein RIT38_607 [Bacteroidota bacterium]|jgi:hypothetical protein
MINETCAIYRGNLSTEKGINLYRKEIEVAKGNDKDLYMKFI